MQNLSVIYKTVNVTVSVSGTFHHRTALNPFLNGTKSVDFDSSVRVNEALCEIVIWINFFASNVNVGSHLTSAFAFSVIFTSQFLKM